MKFFLPIARIRSITGSTVYLFFRDLLEYIPYSGPITLLLLVGFASNSQGFQGTAGNKPHEYRDHQYNYAETLFSQKQYIEAAVAYDRFVFFYPADPRVPTARYQAALSYFNGNQYDDAILKCRSAIEKEASHDEKARFYLLSASSWTKKGDFNQALVTIHNILSIYENRSVRDEAYYLGAWIYIQTGQWHQALSWLKNTSVQKRNTPEIGLIMDRLRTVDTIPQKRPRLAGMLAIFPGAGHLYNGRYQDAVTSFLLNGLAMWAGYEAFDNDLPVLGSLIGLVSINLYIGSIYSAVNATHRYNRRANQQFIKGFDPPARLKISMGLENGGAGLIVNLSF